MKEEKKEENALQKVTNLVKDYEANGELQFPKNYSATNNLKSAWLVLQETVDKDKKPVLQSCSQKSVIQSLLKMVTLGLSVVKGQCYFVPYGGNLSCIISYMGKEAIAKRHRVKYIVSNTVFEKDEFSYEVNLDTGLKQITKHVQGLDTIDPKNFKGAYAIVTFEDGRQELTVMTKSQIVQAWNQRQGNGLSPAHQNFGDQMAEKTVINRALKQIIGSSNDDDLDFNEPKESRPTIPETANSETIDFDDHEDVTEEKSLENKPVDKVPEKKEEPQKVDANKKNVDLFEGDKTKKDPF
jgi:recombination protein RecT